MRGRGLSPAPVHAEQASPGCPAFRHIDDIQKAGSGSLPFVKLKYSKSDLLQCHSFKQRLLYS